MKPKVQFILCLSLFSMIIGCRKAVIGKKIKIKGVVISKQCGSVVPNANLSLVNNNYQKDILNGKTYLFHDIISRTTTDNNGNFTLEYNTNEAYLGKKDNLSLEIDKEILPVNPGIKLDSDPLIIPEGNHSNIVYGITTYGFINFTVLNDPQVSYNDIPDYVNFNLNNHYSVLIDPSSKLNPLQYSIPDCQNYVISWKYTKSATVEFPFTKVLIRQFILGTMKPECLVFFINSASILNILLNAFFHLAFLSIRLQTKFF